MHTYLVELYFPPYPNQKRRIRAQRWDLKSDARDQLSPDMIKYAFVDAMNINIARHSARQMMNAPDAVLEKRW